jgi:hypothetical protein
VTGDIRLVVKDFGFTAGGWRVDKHMRFVADITGDRRPDIIGLGENNIITSLAKGDGTYSAINVSLPAFSFAQGWRVDKHPRFMVDTTGDGKSDIVGFGEDGVWISGSLGNGDFQSPMKVVDDFGFAAGGWRMDKHLRLMGDITGDGRADIVGFGEANVWVAVAQPDGTYSHVFNGVNDFSFAQGWRVDKHPRFLADTTGDGKADIVGFGEGGVWLSRNPGKGQFEEPKMVINDFGFAQGWRVDKHPRFVLDTNGNGRADIVGFGESGVSISELS